MTPPVGPLTAREAAERIVAGAAVQPPLRVPLDAALGLVAAEEIRSPVDVPARANSSMDGYAVRTADLTAVTAGHPVSLAVVAAVAAGQVPARDLGPGECARIFTGAALPGGADAVVRQEDSDLGRERVVIRVAPAIGANVRRAGEDLVRDGLVIGAGTVLRPAHLGLLAAIGVAAPLVVRRPRVALLSGGDEIVDVDRPDEIRSGQRTGSANTHSLQAQVREAGGIPLDLGIARDDVRSLTEHLRGAEDADLVITSGGISVGEHDHVRAAVTALGGTVDFARVRIRPGGPLAAGRVLGVPWIGLPGNPVSAMVTFELFARPAIRRMAGHADPFRRARPVRMMERCAPGPTLQHFLRVVLDRDADPPAARLTGSQGSGILSSMALADALAIVPEGTVEVAAGSMLDAILLDDPGHSPRPAY